MKEKIVLKPTNTDYLFKFSIVTAVYNVEAYLSEAIDSILSQDIGFIDPPMLPELSVMNISINIRKTSS